MTSTPAPVLAAVDHRGWRSVIEYAAAEAVVRGAPLRVLHAVGGPADAVDVGRDLLAAATRVADELVGGRVPVVGMLAVEPPVAAIAAVDGVDLVVVGRSARTRNAHPYARSVTGAVAGRVEAPVVSVPEGWAEPPGSRRVVVGIDEPERAEDVLAAGLRAARDRGARLDVLCARWRPFGAGAGPLTHVRDDGEVGRLEAALSAALDRLLAAAPAGSTPVPVRVVVGHGQPGEALLEAAEEACLVVLGRHATLVPSGSHLGPVARCVVGDAACPVLLAVPARHHWVEPAGMRSELSVARPSGG